MRVTNKIVLFSLLISAAFFIQSASAVLTALPESSHYEGTAYYSGGYVDFAVYDTLGASGNELTTAGFDDAPGIGQYIYAYQIFSNSDNPYTIDFFGIFSIGENALSAPYNDNVGGVTDSFLDASEEGVMPDDAYVGFSEEKGMVGAWEFNNGLLAANEHSWFLLLRSDNDWTVGDYTFVKEDLTQIPVSGENTSNPEPATVILLGLGGALILGKRRIT